MTTDNNYKILKDYYSTGDEDKRLDQDKAHKVEFLTTTRYIDKYLKPNAKIFEVGAGTGIYSIHYAKKGYQVSALEPVSYTHLNKVSYLGPKAYTRFLESRI